MKLKFHCCTVSFFALILVSFLGLAASEQEVKVVPYEISSIAVKYAGALKRRDYKEMDKLFDSGVFCEKLATTLYDKKISRGLFMARECGLIRHSFNKSMFLASHNMQFETKYIGLNSLGRPTIRMSMDDGGYEFLELEIGDTNPPKIVDVFIATRGQFISRSTAEAMGLLSLNEPGVVQKITGLKSIDKDVLIKFRELSVHMNGGSFFDAYQLIDSFPDELKSTRLISTIRTTVAQQIDEITYIEALQDLDSRFGDDDGFTFLLLDYYLYSRDSEKLERAINAVKIRYVNDAAILNLEANINFMAGDAEQALVLLDQAISNEDSFKDPYITKLFIHIALEQTREVLSTFNTMRDHFGDEFVDGLIATNPILAEFR